MFTTPSVSTCRRAGLMCITVLSDYVLWLIVGTALVAGILAADWQNLPFLPKHEQRIKLKVADAYSITKGSQVILMGVPVGQITRVEPDVAGDRVWVSFTLKPESPEIPPHAEAAITAAGLGGAKSLEFYVMREGDRNDSAPDLIDGEKRVHVIAPFRERTMRKYQVTSANSIRHGAEGLSQVLSHVTLGQHKEELRWILNEIQTTQRAMEQFSRDVPRLNKRMNEGVDNLKAMLTQSQQRLDRIATRSAYLGASSDQTTKDIVQNIREARRMITAQQQQLTQLQQTLHKNKALLQTPPVPN
jgi:ABC-type transporter Mla subunit MlaD